jgi:hypothetical protein
MAGGRPRGSAWVISSMMLAAVIDWQQVVSRLSPAKYAVRLQNLSRNVELVMEATTVVQAAQNCRNRKNARKLSDIVHKS